MNFCNEILSMFALKYFPTQMLVCLQEGPKKVFLITLKNSENIKLKVKT